MSELWTPSQGVAQLKHRPKQRTVTLPNGQRAKVTVDDSGHVTHVEFGERVDAIVRPDVIRIKVQRFWGPHGHPQPEGPLKGKDGTYGSRGAAPRRAGRR
jgi:hypothetical protein